MLPLQPGDELVFGTPAASQRAEILNHDLIADHAVEGSNYISFCSMSSQKKQGQRRNLGCRKRQTEIRDGCSIRKFTRRDIERKRRQEMSNLYVSLRSLLPLEHIKGKRSMCDQMHEAVNYIERIQKDIQELRIRRDKLKKLSNFSDRKSGSSNDSNSSPNCVTVELVSNGVEISFTSNIESPDRLGLSWVLAELLERELDVVSCLSTKTKGRFLHKIQAEARDIASLDVLLLKERLTNAIN